MSTSPEMACAEFVERVTDYFEGSLSPVDLERLEEHLGACSHCALYLEQLRGTMELTGELREDDVRPEMRSELLGVFEQWKQSKTQRRPRTGGVRPH